MTPAKIFSCEFCKAFQNTCIIEYLPPTGASESVRYWVHTFLVEVRLEEEEEEECKNYLKITPECFDKLFILMKDDITK